MAVAHPATLCGPAFCFTAWFAPFVKLGASLTGLTVIDTVAVESRPGSFQGTLLSFALNVTLS